MLPAHTYMEAGTADLKGGLRHPGTEPHSLGDPQSPAQGHSSLTAPGDSHRDCPTPLYTPASDRPHVLVLPHARRRQHPLTGEGTRIGLAEGMRTSLQV